MSSDPPQKTTQTTPRSLSPKTQKSATKSGRAQSPKKPAATKPLSPKPKRLCASCQGQVSAFARYCRHCGHALSAEVPANPYLPPPPKPWRPSRIPKQRPQVALPQAPPTALVSPMAAEPMPSQAWKSVHAMTDQATSVALTASSSPPKGFALPPTPALVSNPPSAPLVQPEQVLPRVWDPVPEVEQRMAQLRVMHDRLRPQLSRADLFKRRLRHP